MVSCVLLRVFKFANIKNLAERGVRGSSKASVNLIFLAGVTGLSKGKNEIFGVRAFFCYFFWHQKK